MKKITLPLISLLLTMGVVIALITFGYTLGHEIGSALGNDIVNITEESLDK